MIDYDKFKYRIGDKIRKIGYEAQYEIIEIQSNGNPRGYGSITSYRIKNLSLGCVDQPVWLSQSIIHRNYEPCNPAIKVLFEKKEPIGGALTLEMLQKAIDAATNNSGRLMMISTPRAAGKTWMNKLLADWENRAEPGTGDHLTDALRYATGHKKVSR